MKNFLIALLLIMGAQLTSLANGLKNSTDTVTVTLGGTSKMLFLVENQKDLEDLDKYDINGMLKDLSHQLKEDHDSSDVITIEDESGEKYLKKEATSEYSGEEDDYDRESYHGRRSSRMETSYRFGLDIGLNNYLEDGKFPDQSGALYTIRPMSWNVAINSNWRSHLIGKLFMDWGPNIMWYNYFFQDKNTRIIKTDDGVEFVENDPPVGAQSSKLGITYINFQAVPILYLGQDRGSRYGRWSGNWCNQYKFRGVRIGLGGYTGYRIDSWSKFVYKDESGKKQRDKQKDNYYLNNWRYGLRFLFGFRGFTLYTNYDLNSLFSGGRGPELQAISFGIAL